ncbi:MAG TPA: choice-of-anchor R domain-containing protein [Chthoniobacterales bacterium]
MREKISVKIGLAILALAVCGAVMAQEADQGRGQTGADAEAAQITFGSNFVADPCQTCKYNSEPSGFFVWGRDNCTSPGDIQSVAVPFIAAANGIPNRILTSIILNNPTECPTNTVTLGLYTDTCGDGPGTLLAQANATVADAACELTSAKLAGAPALSEGTKYWITATTTAAQTGLDSRWYASNNARYSFDLGAGWQASNGTTPAFAIQGPGTISRRAATAAAHPAFGGNLFVDPCTGCNYNPNTAGLDVRGPENCTWPGQTASLAVPFVAQRTGAPQRISAAIILQKPHHLPL